MQNMMILIRNSCGCRRACIENLRWHDLLRHTWATAAMVERYAHVSSDALVASAGRLENFVSGYDLATVRLK